MPSWWRAGRSKRSPRSAQESVGLVAAGVDRALSAIRTVRAAGATDREEDALAAEAERAYGFGVRVAKVGAVLWPISGLAIQGAFLAVLGLGGYRVAAGMLSVDDLVTFVLFLFLMLMPLGQAFSAIITVRTALGAIGRIEEIIALPAEHDDPAAGAASGAGGGGGADDLVVFDAVTFGYRDTAPVLREVSFAAARGRTTAVVGPSGAGKSTILALVERFYEVEAGAVRVGGLDVRAMPRDRLRAGIGYVEQDAPVLAGTIRANLLLAAPEAPDARCREVLESVNLLTRIDEHPDGLDAVVGDDGIGLSGGERQRLAIARALIADVPLLLLDEPTSALDGHNERAMRMAIRSAAAGRTVLIVAHRLATIADADRIVVLDAGRVVAVGTHDELVAAGGLYAELARHQRLS